MPFNQFEFEWSEEISSFLHDHVPNYGEFMIKLNGEEVYKPYRNIVGTSRKSAEKIKGVEFFELKAGDKTLAYGWQGIGSRLLGAIRPKDGVSGLRVKVGNITIGGDRLLDDCFRERRFNGYVIGEIHIVDSQLIPNSRRDDFVDNREKTLFYNSVERNLGLPISREIRLRSRLNSQGLRLRTDSDGIEAAPASEPDRKCSCRPTARPENKIAGTADDLFSGCGDCEKIHLIKEKLGL